MASPA
ncbi:hypothetical protein TIFTF001_056561 [Ficus carica]|jgi:hypothetical protein